MMHLPFTEEDINNVFAAVTYKVDPELAMVEADNVEDDEALRKKLWLMVAKHVVEQEKGTKIKEKTLGKQLHF
ncbi:hypothetical protein Tco_1288069 [Tanacetum coccineum]